MTVAPPAANTWDLAAIAADALRVLRLGQADADVDRVEAAATAATELLDAELDYTAPFEADAVAALHAAAVQVTIELYRRKDAPFGVIDSWSQDTVAFRISGDPLAGVRRMVLPWKARWGVA